MKRKFAEDAYAVVEALQIVGRVWIYNHHIYLNKKRRAPKDIITLCASCHFILHLMLQKKQYIPANPKHYMIINRQDHISYIHKKTHKIIKIKRRS